jgi:hypothetical protein
MTNSIQFVCLVWFGYNFFKLKILKIFLIKKLEFKIKKTFMGQKIGKTLLLHSFLKMECTLLFFWGKKPFA